jgi:lysophospholipase L1-like esterase
MNTVLTKTFAILFALACLIACTSATTNEPSNYRDPAKFEKDIQKFEAADAQDMPPQNAVLCVGSSSIRMWHRDLARDLDPLTVIGRGFGGSNTNDLLHYADRIVVNYKPRAIMIYEGDNDVAQGIEPNEIVATYTKLLNKIEADLPGCRVYILAIKPSIKRWDMWPTMSKVNDAFAALAKKRKHVTYLDIVTPMLGDDGKPKPDLFIKDNLHLNRKGYELWRDTIRPVLVEAEKNYEQE